GRPPGVRADLLAGGLLGQRLVVEAGVLLVDDPRDGRVAAHGVVERDEPPLARQHHPQVAVAGRRGHRAAPACSRSAIASTSASNSSSTKRCWLSTSRASPSAQPSGTTATSIRSWADPPS